MTSRGRDGECGMSLIELIIAATIVGILAAGIYPIVRYQAKREKEQELRYDLLTMRRAIDQYKRAGEMGGFQIKQDTFGYPADLQSLADGVDVKDKKVKFLRAVPVDPMTGTSDWGMRSMQDEADATTWGGQNVFNVYSKSDKTGLNGTKYSTW